MLSSRSFGNRSGKRGTRLAFESRQLRAQAMVDAAAERQRPHILSRNVHPLRVLVAGGIAIACA